MNQVAEPVSNPRTPAFITDPARPAKPEDKVGTVSHPLPQIWRELTARGRKGTITADGQRAGASHLGDDRWRISRIFFATSRLALADPAFAAVTERWGDAALGSW